MAIDTTVVYGYLAALFCGAFLGVEREMGKSAPEADGAAESVAARNPAGIRTHILAALFGATAQHLDPKLGANGMFTVVAFVAVAAFAVTVYAVRARATGHYGTTSVLTLFLTFGLGVLCFAGQIPLAIALAVVVTGILTVKVPLHTFVRTLTRAEIAAAVKFGLVALVLLPLLPDRDFGPLDWPWLAEQLRAAHVAEPTMQRLALVNPYSLWFLVVAISGLSFVGYVLVRTIGPGRGLVLTGLAGGMVSSTATSLAMAAQSRRTPHLRHSIVAAVLAACSVMALRVLIVSAAFATALFTTLLAPVGAMLVSGGLVAFWLARRAKGGTAEGALKLSTPFALGPALKLTGLFLLVRTAGELATILIGTTGLYLTAALSGIVDVDAITVAVGQQVKAQEALDARVGAGAIFLAVAVNTVVKASMVLVSGDRAVGRTVFLALAGTLLAGATGLALVLLV
ncbi:MAG: MgtC/SapB family protein [Planctomycetes bacterium]|nr:MgtC/SapB family protein [Planctomycetota bacterium]